MNLKVTAAQMLLWAKTCFGTVALDKRERALRLLEESCELAQAAGLTPQDLQAIGTRVFSRPKDTVHKELGGVFVTLLAFAHVNEEDLEVCLLDEVTRILSKPVEYWRGKHDAKAADGIITAPAC